MSVPHTVPSAGSKDLVTSTISIEGEVIPRTIEVSAITIFKGIGKIPFARVEILDGDPAGQTFPQSENELFAPGGKIEIQAGYRSEENLIFRGMIVGQKIRLRKSGRGLLTLLCRHALFPSTLTKKSVTYLEASDSDAFSTALGSYDVDVSVEDTDIIHEKLLQFQESDWDFALHRAQMSGHFLIPADDGVSLTSPVLSGDAALSLQMGATIFEIDLEMDCRTQPVESTATSWDRAAQDLLESTGQEPGYEPGTQLTGANLAEIHGQNFHDSHPGTFSQEELDAFASSQLLSTRLASHYGRVRCTGTPAPEPGKLLALEGLGAQFNGTHLISAVRHELYEGQWVTDIQVGLLDEKVIVPSVPSTQTSGLHLAVVEALSDDPEGEFRVQISIPTLGDEAAPIWARLSSPTAGDSRGMAFFPDVGDEVVVSFLDDDPHHPVILGSLFSSALPPHVEPDDDNFHKGFVTREELKFLFDDDLKSIVLETPNGNSITLSDDEGGIILEDENGNSLTLNADGAVLDSTSDIGISAGGDVALSGTNIETTASAQLTASGSSGAEFSASGTTVVKGAMVQIN